MMRRLFTGLRHAISLHLRPLDRLLLVILVSKTRSWRSALLLVQPDTLLRWHRELVLAWWWLGTERLGPAGHAVPLAP